MAESRHNDNVRDAVLLLLAKDFSEGMAVHCLERLRQEGVLVSLVGLSSRLIRGFHGLTVKPDYSIEQLPERLRFKLIILPDGKSSVSKLFADPRVHQLIENTLAHHGRVAATPDAEAFLEASGLVTPETVERFVWWHSGELEDFASALADQFT